MQAWSSAWLWEVYVCIQCVGSGNAFELLNMSLVLALSKKSSQSFIVLKQRRSPKPLIEGNVTGRWSMHYASMVLSMIVRGVCLHTIRGKWKRLWIVACVFGVSLELKIGLRMLYTTIYYILGVVPTSVSKLGMCVREPNMLYSIGACTRKLSSIDLIHWQV